jgi:uncharacterized protein (DUF362 family)
MDVPQSVRRGMSRRGFLAGAGLGLAAGAGLGWLGARHLHVFQGKSVEVRRPTYAMPGPYPGRVIEVHHPAAVTAPDRVDADAVHAMMTRGICELTGADHVAAAWRRLFEPSDVVGIKLNPVGHRQRPGVISVIANPAVLLETVAGLKSAGVHPRNILVFERYASEFRQAGYEAVMRERSMDGVRWFASGFGYDPDQLNIDGLDERGRMERDPHVVGYDPDCFVSMSFCAPNHDRRDERRFRSHLSMVVTRMVNKFINIPCLKDHRSAGVTLALKNLSHGMNNNVARSHIEAIHRRDGAESGPNQCNTFIPTAAGQEPIRQKATLHILDGLIGVYEGGPGSWNRSWSTWPARSLFFATDPVALDHVGWDVVDTKRVAEGWRPVGQVGRAFETPAGPVATWLGSLAGRNPRDVSTLTAAADYVQAARATESFDRRQPEHVILAGLAGLGTFEARDIDHRAFTWDVNHAAWSPRTS